MTLEFLIAVLTYAAPYALCALGMQLVFLPTRAVNFAQGDLMVLGGTIFAVATTRWFPGHLGVAFLVTLAIAVLIAALLAKPVFRRSDADSWGPAHVTLCFIGFSLLANALSFGLGGEQNYAIRPGHLVELDALRALSRHRDDTIEGVALAASIVCLLLCTVTIHLTRFTKRLDAIGVARDAFALWEQSDRPGVWGVFFGLALGIMAGAVVAPLNYADPHIGLAYGYRAFAVLLLAQFWRGSPFAVILGSLGLASLEQVVIAHMPRVFADFIPAGVVVFCSMWFYGGLRLFPLRWRSPLSSRALFESMSSEEYEMEHTGFHLARSHNTPGILAQNARDFARAIRTLFGAGRSRGLVIAVRGGRLGKAGVRWAADSLGVTGTIALCVMIWCLIRAMVGDRGAINAFVTAVPLAALLPLQWVVQRWLRETWLFGGALALIGGYAYAYSCHASVTMAIGLASVASALAAVLMLLFTTFLRKIAVPLFTITIHLALLAALTNAQALGGAEGLHRLPGPFSARAKFSTVLLLSIPAFVGALYSFGLARTIRGQRLRAIGRDPVAYEALGGHRFRTAALPVAICAALLGCAAALGVAARTCCSPRAFDVLISLLPVIAVGSAERLNWAVAVPVLAGPLLLPRLIPDSPLMYKSAVALFVLVALVAGRYQRRKEELGGTFVAARQRAAQAV